MRNTYRIKTFRRFTPKPPDAQLLNAIQSSKFLPKSDIIEEAYVSQYKFTDFEIAQELKTNIRYKGYDVTTPIQDKSIPVILSGKDIIGIANTGTGKTAAFLIPLINKVFKDRNQRVFILAPTRELAVQINDELKDLSVGMSIYSALCIGGANMQRQKMSLRQDPNFVIGTPGRIKDLSSGSALKLSRFNNVVLDEADRMVDIGFINEIKYLISLLPKERHSLFFSATISGKVKQILENFVTDPVVVSVKQRETSENISQDIIKVGDRSKKVDLLHDLLIKEGFDKILIFGRTKWGVQKLANELVLRGFKADAIHGNKGQNQRQRTLDRFKKSEINILLATDVASRGLDIPDVTHVINYDMPATYEDYIHRIGRTGRANKKGVALTFLD